MVLLSLVLALSPWGHAAAATLEPDASEVVTPGSEEALPGEDDPPDDGSSLRDELPPEERLAEAGAAFGRGVAAFKQERFEDALEEFSRAQELAPHPDTLFNLGLAQQSTDHHVEAWKSFEQLLEDAPDDPEREEILAMQAISRPHVAWLRVHSETEGLVCFDGRPMPTDDAGVPYLMTTPGSHRLDIDRAHRPLELRGGEDRTVELELATPTAPPMSRRGLRALAGLSIAGASASAGLGLGAALVEPTELRVGMGAGAAASGVLAVTTTVIALVAHRRRRRWTPPPPLRACPP